MSDETKPAIDVTAAKAAIEADLAAKRDEFGRLVDAATKATGCEFGQRVVSWVENGVVRVAPELHIVNRRTE